MQPLFLRLLALCSLAAAASPDLFLEVAEPAGLRFRHVNGAGGSYFLPEIMGAGVALFDYDNDGDLDVFLVQGIEFDGPPKGGGHRLFRNELIPSGSLRFTDVSERAGVNHRTYGMGVSAGDFDNDGWTDLFVTGLGQVVLFRNNGDGTFSDHTRASGISNTQWSTSAAWVDYDLDGDLDLYVANYLDFSVAGNKSCYAPGGERDYCSPSVYTPVTDRLYRNEGNGRFTDVTLETGIASASGPGLGVVCFDYDQDGWPDIFVANDGAANLLWRNKKGASFENVALETGVAFNTDGMPQAGMGVDAADFRRTGFDDLLVANMRHETYNLYTFDAKGFFADRATRSGLARITYSHTGFGVRFFDYDHDGWLDIFLANGAVTRRPELRGDAFPYHETNQLLQGQAGGSKLLDVSPTAGPALALSESSRGLALGDIDNDGDLDLVISNNNGPVRLLVNQTPPTKRAISFRLVGVKSNRSAIGTRVTIYVAGQAPQRRRVQSDGSYLSSSDPRVHFGLGDASEVDRVEVQWPGGARETWRKLTAGTVHTLTQGRGTEGDGNTNTR